MVQNGQYLNGPPSHVTFPFEYRTPILSGILMVTVVTNAYVILFAEESAARPRLRLLPRSVKDPVNALAETMQKQSIFGDAKPREEVLAGTTHHR